MRTRWAASLRRRRWIAGILAVFLFATVSAHAQPPGEITGTITDDAGTALAGATVTLRGAVHRSATTDEAGRFRFENVADGTYELTAALQGFAPVHRGIRLVSGRTAPLVLTLSVEAFEETMVTASKTGERDLQTIPMAVSAIGAPELQRVQANDVSELAGRAPLVTFSQNSDYSQLTIRGIGSNVVFAGSDPSSAVYADGVYLARPVMALTEFLDLDRVEVLRGPQGTLYGRNAVGGALNLVSKVPTDTVEASARLAAGDLGTFRGEARVSGPIVGNRLMASAAILRGTSRGFVRDLNHPDHPLGSEDITAARSRVRAVFNRWSDLLVSGDFTHQTPTPLTYAKVLAVKPGFEVDNPADLHEVRASTLAGSRNVQYGASALLTLRLGSNTRLTSLSAFRKLDYRVINDADITELDLTAVDLREMQHQVSEEASISHDGARLTWIAGLFLLDDDDRQPTLVRLGGPRLLNLLNPNVDATSRAGFGQTTFNVTSRVSLTAGLRFTRERKRIDNAGQLSALDAPGTVVPGSAYAYTDAISHSAWTPKVGLDIRASGSSLIYLSASRGFKTGGFNISSREPGLGYAPEWAWSYEAGYKTSSAGGRMRFSVAGFQTDYTNLQVQQPIRPGVLDISNAAAAILRGIELENTTQLTRTLHAGGHVAWLDAVYDRYIAVGIGGITGDVAGNRLNNAPEWSGRAWLQWNGDIGRGRELSLRADARWQNTVFFTPFNDVIQRQRPYGLLDASAECGLTRWSRIGIYGRNLTNQDYITGTFSTPPPAIGGRPGYPRQVGVQLIVER